MPPSVHRISKTDEKQLIHYYCDGTSQYHGSQIFFTSFLEASSSLQKHLHMQNDRQPMKKKGINFPLTPIQMTKKYAEMSEVREQP